MWRYLLVLFVACGKAEAPAPDVAPPAKVDLALVPNDYLLKPERTYVRPTAGDDRADQIGMNQIDMLRAAELMAVDDTSIDIAAGAGAWPAYPIVYGGPDINSLVGRLAPVLPFELTLGRLVIGGETYAGADIRLAALVPEHRGELAHPAFVLYAATTPHGIAEINSGSRGAEPIFVRDAFGALAMGKWVERDGKVVAAMGPRARRIAWRTLERVVGALPVRFHFPEMVPPAADDEATIAACVAGVEIATSKLGIAPTIPLEVYVYPDRRSKQSLTGDQGDGHAVLAAHALHVLKFEPAGMTSLMAHEATHILAFDAFGLPGMSLTGEGLAVWVSGQYGGKALSDWKLDPVPQPGATVGISFRKLKEEVGYPYAGTFVAVAIERLGIEKVTRAIVPLSPFAWDEGWARLGVEPATIHAEVARRLTK